MNDIKYCDGCHDEVYHHGCGGSTKCWSFDSMKLIKRKEVHISQRPPWTQKAKLIPHCYHRSQYVYVAADRTF